MAEIIALAASAGAIIAVIRGIIDIGGAPYNLANSHSSAVESLHAFERELLEFCELWEQVQDHVDLRNPNISRGLRQGFLGFVERTNRDLDNAYREFDRFFARERVHSDGD